MEMFPGLSILRTNICEGLSLPLGPTDMWQHPSATSPRDSFESKTCNYFISWSIYLHHLVMPHPSIHYANMVTDSGCNRRGGSRDFILNKTYNYFISWAIYFHHLVMPHPPIYYMNMITDSCGNRRKGHCLSLLWILKFVSFSNRFQILWFRNT